MDPSLKTSNRCPMTNNAERSFASPRLPFRISHAQYTLSPSDPSHATPPPLPLLPALITHRDPISLPHISNCMSNMSEPLSSLGDPFPSPPISHMEPHFPSLHCINPSLQLRGTFDDLFN